MPASGVQPDHIGAAFGRRAAFSALRYRNFRVIWTGLTVSAVGTWMQIIAQSLLVLDLTHGSATALGIVSLAQAASFFLFTPIGGGIADRFDRRSVLLLTQSVLAGLATLLGALTATQTIRFWMIPVIAFAAGAILSFDQPSRNAFVATLVPKQSLMNALSLQAAVFNGASVLGPALAGLTLSRIGYEGNFFLNAASYSAVLLALLLVRTAPADAARSDRRSLLASVREALTYVRRDAVLPSTVAAFATLLFFGPSAALVLPIFARQIAQIESVQLGILFAASGCGTVMGALLAASLGEYPRKRGLIFASILVWTSALAVFAFTTSCATAIPSLLVMGAAQSTAGAAAITLLQSRVPPDMRGRAMAVNTLLIMCVRPLGDFPVATLMAFAGFRSTLLICAGIVGSIVLTLAVAGAKRPETLGSE